MKLSFPVLFRVSKIKTGVYQDLFLTSVSYQSTDKL